MGFFFPFLFLIRKLLISLIPPISTGVIQRQIASSKYPVCILSSKEHHPIPSIPLKFPKLSPHPIPPMPLKLPKNLFECKNM
jgi:hypothetical protein